MAANKIDLSFPATVVLSGLSLGVPMIEDVPNQAVVLIWAITAVSFVWLIWSVIMRFRPEQSLPISFKSLNIIGRGYTVQPDSKIDAHLSLSDRTFQAKIESLKEVHGKTITVEYHHRYSQDGLGYKRANTVFAELRLSSSGEQLLEVITSRRTTQAFGKGFKLYNVLLNLADKTLPMIELGKFNIFDIVFSHEDYLPVKKTVWINSRGQIFQNKPKSWPNEKTNQL